MSQEEIKILEAKCQDAVEALNQFNQEMSGFICDFKEFMGVK